MEVLNMKENISIVTDKEGRGKYRWKNVSYYEGQFNNGIFNGEGKYIIIVYFFIKVILIMTKKKEMEKKIY